MKTRHRSYPARALRYARARFRRDDFWLAGIAALLGIVCGVSVAAFDWLVKHIQLLAFGLGTGEISGADAIPPDRLWVPLAGGIAVGATIWIAKRLGRRLEKIDPIEANALTGGRIPLPGALWIMVQTLLSHGMGASVGMEGAHTQLCSALGSKAGSLASGRRNDMRLLVACGAGASIAALFQSPIAGAFYAFELVIAAYSIGNLAPVVIASLAAAGTRMVLYPSALHFAVPALSLGPSAVVMILMITFATVAMAITVMRCCTRVETLLRAVMPSWLAPVVGGAGLAVLALASPAVLSSGRSALQNLFAQDAFWWLLAGVLVLKALAVILSIGTGFRGGLSFASLFLGMLCGKLIATLMALLGWQPLPTEICELVGMTVSATAIIGAPLAMAFLVAFATGDIGMVVPLVCVAALTTVLVRRLFGFSFATWRFHLRGDPIRSAADVGWLQELKVGEMMRRDATPVLYDTDLAQFRKRYPPGSRHRVVVADRDGTYLGILSVPELHNPASDDKDMADLLRLSGSYLPPEMTAPEALKHFARSGSDALAVVDRDTHKALGVLMEPYVLRRSAELAERRMHALVN
ncbi:MAG: chloride channel protein [Salipiger marinus]|uniref:chloride channel protein n=1 Tax=Salipiger marinus TaxID=555512 RepID=UPI004057CC38